MEILYTPWRLQYIESDKTCSGKCIFCEMKDSEPSEESLILYSCPHAFVVLNRFPYNNGHLLIVPREHVSSLTGVPAKTLHRCSELLTFSEQALRKAYNPNGLNAGLNLGEAAGAGIEEHIHWHILPRWRGDTSFVTVLGKARIVPEELVDTYRRLRPFFEELSP